MVRQAHHERLLVITTNDFSKYLNNSFKKSVRPELVEGSDKENSPAPDVEFRQAGMKSRFIGKGLRSENNQE
jgi:hypothetical protein